ncbi:MAG: glycosyltransferase [Planctomycetes bacterium]|nr:glycosyltransferase [Planctomycetota bacterium]
MSSLQLPKQPLPVAAQPDAWAIGMVSAPRPERTVENSLAELRRAGFSETIHLFEEPGTHTASMPGVLVHTNTRRRGVWHNWRDAAGFLLEHTDAPFLLVCEDDIELTADAALALHFALQHMPHEAWGFASLYTPWHNVVRHRPVFGWQAVAVGADTWGALAWCFSRAALNWILDTTAGDTASDGHTDQIVGSLLGGAGYQCFYHIPSLCEHAGQGKSSTGHRHVAEMKAVGFAHDSRLYVAAITTAVAVSEPAPSPDACASARRPSLTMADRDAMTTRTPHRAALNNRPPSVMSQLTDSIASGFSDTTVCVTVLFRFDALRTLLRSIRRFYPTIPIVVADNSFRPADWGKEEFSVFQQIICEHDARAVLLPFNSGISATRNAAVAAADTPCVVVAEEDFEFTRQTNLEKMLRPIRAGQADIVGGLEHYTNETNGWLQACVPQGAPRTVQYAANVGFAGAKPLRRLVIHPIDCSVSTELSGVICRRSDVIHNFYAARRAVYMRAPCDEQLRVCEHLDHFLRLKQADARVFYTPESAIDHFTPETRPDPRFRALRDTGGRYHRRFCENWGLDPRGSDDFGMLIRLTSISYIERQNAGEGKAECMHQ